MNVNFLHLSAFASGNHDIQALWHQLYHDGDIQKQIHTLTQHIDNQQWQNIIQEWQTITTHDNQVNNNSDDAKTAWLIQLFNLLYNHCHGHDFATALIKGDGEPEYFAPQGDKPARIEFAHGFFQSALHEISHWCIAGKTRRLQDDFGYWYAADGRNQEQQRQFEQVEIKPQAIECLLSLALGRYFFVSQDNLNADFDTSNSSFAQDVFAQAQQYLQSPSILPQDAKALIWIFHHIAQSHQRISS